MGTSSREARPSAPAKWGLLLRCPLTCLTMLLAAYPMWGLLWFYSYVLQARLQLGHWPSYNNPDPQQLAWPVACLSLHLGLTLAPLAGILASVLIVVARLRSREFPVYTAAAVLILSQALLVAVSQWDPGDFFAWFAD